MKKSALLCVIACSIGLSQLAYANHHEEGKSKDGEKCEGMSHGSFSISGLDANKDGSISKSEYLEGDKSNKEKTFKHIDANSDGILDQSEQAEIEAVYKAIHQDYKSKNISI
jgi:EF hand